jgi:hypothetical protein
VMMYLFAPHAPPARATAAATAQSASVPFFILCDPHNSSDYDLVAPK